MMISVMKCNSINESIVGKYRHCIFDVFVVIDRIKQEISAQARQCGKIWIDCIEIC